MAANDEFESFRGAIADLDADRERRIRQRFETLRVTNPSPPTSPVPGDESPAVELVPVADTPTRPARDRRPVLVGIAAAVVLVAVIGALTLFRSSGTTTDIGSGIDEDNPLSQIAARALARPDVDLVGDQVLYQQKTTAEEFPGTADLASGMMVLASETWARRDGTGLLRETPGFIKRGPGESPGVGDPRERAVTEPPGFLEVRDYNEIRALPTDPATLLDLVRSTFVTDDSTNAVDFLAGLLALEITPPAVRAAAFQAIGLMGAQSIGQVTTPSGVTGEAYQGTGNDGRPWLIVIDPESTKVLAFAAGAGAGSGLFTDAARWREYGEQRVEASLPN